MGIFGSCRSSAAREPSVSEAEISSVTGARRRGVAKRRGRFVCGEAGGWARSVRRCVAKSESAGSRAGA